VLGVIGGSGFYTFFGADARSVSLDTPYGPPSAPLTVGTVGEHEVAFLPRHGVNHEFSPHTVPYRANMWALRALGVRRVFGPCAVGSLTPDLGPGSMVVPDQLVDRTSAPGPTRTSTPAASTSASPIRTVRRCGRRSPTCPGWSTAAPWS
jgi:5'-methylthioadenosine phosphorylase